MSSPPARYIPDNLYNEYTMNNTINVFDWYCDTRFSETLEWTNQLVEEFINKYSCYNIINNIEINKPYPEGEPYKLASLYNLIAMKTYKEHFINKNIAIIGSLLPWLEAIVYNMGAKSITTVEYNKPKETDKIKTVSFDDFAKSDIKYDAIISYSSIEHSGLGRYGDPLNPNGDLETMKIIHSKLHDNGLVLLGVPIGKDAVVWNAHRIYGEKRLPLMINGFKELEWIGLDKSYIYTCESSNIGLQPVIVLQKT